MGKAELGPTSAARLSLSADKPTAGSGSSTDALWSWSCSPQLPATLLLGTPCHSVGTAGTGQGCHDPLPSSNPVENGLADTRGVLHFPDAAGFLHPVYFRGMTTRVLDTHLARPPPSLRQRGSTGAEAPQKRSREISPAPAPTSCGKGRGGCSSAGQTWGGEICWKKPVPVPSTRPTGSEEPRRDPTETPFPRDISKARQAAAGASQLLPLTSRCSRFQVGD